MLMEINSGVTSQVMDLKTSTPGATRKEEIKTGFKNVDDYSKYLQDKYSYMNTGTTSMQGVPTTVSVSSAFLQKCMNDPEKAKYLEENLAAIPDCAKSAVNGCLGTLTNLSYKIDVNGNISVAISGTNDPDGKIARENAERKAKENREKEKKAEENRAAKEKVEKKRAEKKAEQERIEKRWVEKAEAKDKTDEFTISAVGTNVRSVTAKLAEGVLSGSVSGTVGVDVRV